MCFSSAISAQPNMPTKITDMFPCAVCQQHVSWAHKAVACDNCDVWLHKTCASINSEVFDNIRNQSWQCFCCRSVQNASFTYRSYNLTTSNSFEALSNIPGDDSVFTTNIGSPPTVFKPNIHSTPLPSETKRRNGVSSPKQRSNVNNLSSDCSADSSLSFPPGNNLRIATLNANSIKGKRAELAELVNSTKLDILIMSETNLPSQAEIQKSKKTYKPSEILPTCLDGTIHRPRNLNGGGVMVAVRKGIVAVDLPLQAGKHGEIV